MNNYICYGSPYHFSIHYWVVNFISCLAIYFIIYYKYFSVNRKNREYIPFHRKKFPQTQLASSNGGYAVSFVKATLGKRSWNIHATFQGISKVFHASSAGSSWAVYCIKENFIESLYSQQSKTVFLISSASICTHSVHHQSPPNLDVYM